MKKVDNGEKSRKEGGGGIMTEIVATNIVASLQPERRPTAMWTANANNLGSVNKSKAGLVNIKNYLVLILYSYFRLSNRRSSSEWSRRRILLIFPPGSHDFNNRCSILSLWGAFYIKTALQTDKLL